MASVVLKARDADPTAFEFADPFTLTALRKRASMGEDVPEWINLQTGEVRPVPRKR